ncbi:MAG: hypothetical protein WC733_00085 [Methylophilus sp.]|jgi:hypothetical protein
MGIHIGGAKSYKQVVYGDVVMSLQWVNDEPAMVIWPKIPRTSQNSAYCICLSSAYKYTDDEYLVQQAAICAEVIGLGVSGFSIKRIADVILNNLQDLAEMPLEQMVMPKEKGVAVGEMVLKLNGETIREQEMLEAH